MLYDRCIDHYKYWGDIFKKIDNILTHSCGWRCWRCWLFRISREQDKFFSELRQLIPLYVKNHQRYEVIHKKKRKVPNLKYGPCHSFTSGWRVKNCIFDKPSGCCWLFCSLGMNWNLLLIELFDICEDAALDVDVDNWRSTRGEWLGRLGNSSLI